MQQGWEEFVNIVEMDFTEVDDVIASSEEPVIYNLNGVRVENPTKGIYIQNGKKVVY